MNEIATTVAPYLTVALAVVSALAMVLAIGVGFLARPSRATLDWSIALSVFTITTFGFVAGDVADSDVLRQISAGVALGCLALVWSGFRAQRGVPDLPWIAAVVAVGCAVVLATCEGTPWELTAHRGMLIVAALFAGLLVFEWWRMPRPRPRVLLPLTLASVGMSGIALWGAVTGGLFDVTSDRTSDVVTQLVGFAAVFGYLVCVVVAVTGLPFRDAVHARRSATSTEWAAFGRDSLQNCALAQEAGEACSLIHVQLDDAADIRETAGRDTLLTLSALFEREIRAALPPGTDIGSPEPGIVVALVRRSDAEVRDLLRGLLRRVSTLELDEHFLQASGSAGWAQTSTVGYDLTALRYMAREAAAIAREKGGDRWERVGARVIAQLLNETALR